MAPVMIAKTKMITKRRAPTAASSGIGDRALTVRRSRRGGRSPGATTRSPPASVSLVAGWPACGRCAFGTPSLRRQSNASDRLRRPPCRALPTRHLLCVELIADRPQRPPGGAGDDDALPYILRDRRAAAKPHALRPLDGQPLTRPLSDQSAFSAAAAEPPYDGRNRRNSRPMIAGCRNRRPASSCTGKTCSSTPWCRSSSRKD